MIVLEKSETENLQSELETLEVELLSGICRLK